MNVPYFKISLFLYDNTSTLNQSFIRPQLIYLLPLILMQDSCAKQMLILKKGYNNITPLPPCKILFRAHLCGTKCKNNILKDWLNRPIVFLSREAFSRYFLKPLWDWMFYFKLRCYFLKLTMTEPWGLWILTNISFRLKSNIFYSFCFIAVFISNKFEFSHLWIFY